MSTYTLRDHLDHDWLGHVVSYALTDAERAAGHDWVVQDEQGRALPTQVAAGRVYFPVDHLPALGERRYTLAPRAGQAVPPCRVEQQAGDASAVFGNGRIRIAVPTAAPGGRDGLPAPILHVRHDELQAPYGYGGAVTLSPDLSFDRIESALVTQGELWLDWRVRYVCTNGADYVMDLRLWHDAEHVEIREASTLCRDSGLAFEFDRGLPGRPLSFGRLRSQRPDQVIDVADFASKRGGDIGAIQMPLQNGMWILDDYYHACFLDATGGHGAALCFAGIRNTSWDYPHLNQLDFEHVDGVTRMRASITAGHRAWLLVVTDAAALQAATPWTTNAIYALTRRYETRLDTVKDYVLDWDEVAATARPVAAASPAQLERARRLVHDDAQFRDYRARCNPELPGDYTYYHAGTHRPFKDEHWNDPAVCFVTADSDAERHRQAEHLRDVVLTGLRHRLHAILRQGGHIDGNNASINVGRGLRPWAALYDLAASVPGVFTDAQERWIRAVFAFYAYKIVDPDYWPAHAILSRDDHPQSNHRSYWFPGRQSDWNFYNIDTLPHNFHGDLWSACGCVAMIFPNHPNSRAWLDQTLVWWECELTDWVFPEGAWLESSTYTLNSMKDYLIYCAMLYNRRIRDYFADERLQRAFRCIAEHLGPIDPRIGGNTLPVMGDGSYPNVFCYVTGWMAGLSADSDPAFASLMSDTWHKTGRYLVEPGRFGLNVFDFLFQNPALPQTELPHQTSKWYHGLGAILRHAWRSPDEIYLFIKAGKIYSHFHEPEGTFQLWWNSQPLCDEYGVQYGQATDGTPLWHPSAHNCVEIPGHDACYNKGDISTWISTPDFDYVRVDAPILKAYLREGEGIWGFKGEMAPTGWHRRHFFFVKPRYLYILDELDCPLPSTYHLNITADARRVAGDTVHYTGRYGTDLAVLLQDLAGRQPRHDELEAKTPENVAFKPPPRFYHQLRLHVDSAPYAGYRSLLVPHAAGAAATPSDDPASGGARIAWDGATEHSLLFPEPREVATADLVYRGQVGAVHRSADTLTLRQAVGNRIGVPGRLSIDGDGPFTATLRAGELSIRSTGLARWLTVTGLPGGPRELYLKPGDQTLSL